MHYDARFKNKHFEYKFIFGCFLFAIVHTVQYGGESCIIYNMEKFIVNMFGENPLTCSVSVNVDSTVLDIYLIHSLAKV